MHWSDLVQSSILLRVPGDVALVLSYPILWWRFYSVGLAAISFETQLLHALVFFFRYLCYPQDLLYVSTLNSLAKLLLVVCSILTAIAVFCHERSLMTGPFKPRTIFLSLTCLTIAAYVAIFPTPLLLYTYIWPSTDVGLRAAERALTWSRLSYVPWGVSQVLGMVAMVPQLRLLYRYTGKTGCVDHDIASTSHPDGKISPKMKIAEVDHPMWYYLLSMAMFRSFYILYWLHRLVPEITPSLPLDDNSGVLSIISDGKRAFALENLNLMRIGAVVQTVIIHGFIVAIVVRENRAKRQLRQQQHLQQRMFCSERAADSLPEKTPILGHDVKNISIPR
ncbi:hypothetical protein DL93DRAFT_2168850 [Clavulina sp. PMI_390]|nr:hypothetical protein DL93DRAFT_2168850 [Clavulina sp. PMI_390]